MKRYSARVSPSLLMILIAFSILSGSCKKKQIPVLITAEVSNITTDSATGGGTITDEGSSAIISLGICWSKYSMPTINDFKTSEMAGFIEFSSTMKGLLPGTKYYVRAYAVNDEGIGYGDEVSFTTL